MKYILKLLSFMGVIFVIFGLAMFSLPQPAVASDKANEDVKSVNKAKSQAQDIESIITLVNQYCDNGQIYGSGVKGLCNSLVTKLDGAIDARDRGQPKVACNKLHAFTNEVAAKKDKQIKPEAADTLIQQANAACQVLTSDVGDIILEMTIQLHNPPTYQILYYGGSSTETLHFSPTIIYISKPVMSTTSQVTSTLLEAPIPTATVRPTPWIYYEPSPSETVVLTDVYVTKPVTPTPALPDIYYPLLPGITSVLTTITVSKPITPTELHATSIDVVDNWELLMSQSFEAIFPYPPCEAFDDNDLDGKEYVWDEDNFKPRTGKWAGWPAKGGKNGLNPAKNSYPPNLKSFIRCGPFDLSNAEWLVARFDQWLEIRDSDDKFSIGYSTDGQKFSSLVSFGDIQDWQKLNVYLTGSEGEEKIWVLWGFTSDSDFNDAQGVWLDNLEIWRYNKPQYSCGKANIWDRGLVIPAYEQVGNLGEFPIIRAGDTTLVEGLIEAKAKWARVVFEQRNGNVDVRAYDIMVDTLCANGISTLGILNDQTINQTGFNDPDTSEAFRLSFMQKAMFMASHFRGRVKYWEIWNEPNYDTDPDPIKTGPPRIEPELYARLLKITYINMKFANPEAKVLFGGLAGAWTGENSSHDYLLKVYDEWDGGPGMFDYFAIHPYPGKELDPVKYMHEKSPTILTPFMQKMADEGDGKKKTWITEVGWNSAKGQPNIACQDGLVVDDQTQADYLTESFDILFKEAKLWNSSCPAVDKVIWYQYMDVGIPRTLACPNEARGRMGWKGYVSPGYVPQTDLTMQQADSVPWWFGIYQGDKRTPKASQCAFAAYPEPCSPPSNKPNKIFLPLILSPGNICP